MPEDFPPIGIEEADAAPPPNIPDYTLLRRIGRGSYGDVWLARSVTGVFRVIKVVQRSRFKDSRPYLRELEGISRFQAAVSGRPRQLALLHVGRNDEAGYFYYIMEPADDVESGSAIDPDRYVPLTLREMFERRGRLPAAECVQFVLELARGLAVLHEANLIHRDIKPSNVIFVQRVPKLADVGLVASIDATLTGVGTPGYIPPEGPGSVAADIYSLGKVLYEIATGMDRKEFPRIPIELTEASDAPLLREINSVVLKACHRFPDKRHASAAALARDLELIQAGRSVIFYEQVRKRSRAVLFATATVAVLAGIAAALFVWRAQVFQRANTATRRALYRSDLAVAQLARASGDLGRARAALRRQIPEPGQEDLRGLEWAILAKAVRSEGSPLEDIPNPTGVVEIAASGSGRWVAASFKDKRVALWDLNNGRIHKIIQDVEILGGFMGDDQVVIDKTDRSIHSITLTKNTSSKWAINHRLDALLPDGRIMGVSPNGDYIFRLFEFPDKPTGSECNVSTLFPKALVADSAISPNGNSIAMGLFYESGAIRDRYIVSMNFSKGTELWRKQVAGRLGWIQASPNSSNFIANIDWTQPIVFSYSDPNFQKPLIGHTARINDSAFSTSGDLIATASADQSIRIWNAETGELISVRQGLDRPASAVAWLNSSQRIIAGDEGGQIRVFPVVPDVVPDSTEGLFSDLHGDIAISPNGSIIASTRTTNSIGIISSGDMSLMGSISSAFQPIAFDASGLELIALQNDWTPVRANIVTRQVELLGEPLPTDFSVVAWAISPDSRRYAMTDTVGRIATLDLASGDWTIATDPSSNLLWAITFSPSSHELFSGSVDGSIRKWNSISGSLLSEVTRAQGELQSLAISPDGGWIVAGLLDDAGIQVYDVKANRWVTRRGGHRRFVQVLFFTDSGRRLVSGGVDGRVIIWSVPDFEEISSFDASTSRRSNGDEGISALRMSQNHQLMVALTETGRISVWRIR